MNAALADLLALLQAEAEGAFAVFLRMSAFFALMPGFGERTVPVRVKIGLAVVMTVIVAPAIEVPQLAEHPLYLILTETVTGAMLGLGIRMFVLGLQTAGVIAAQSTSLSQLLGGNGADPLPAMGHILIVAGLAIAVITGLHVKAAQFFILSYELVPAGQFPDPSVFSQWGVHRVGEVFTLAFSISAPFVILSVIYNLALGAINKAMPQLMVAFVGAPLITAGGLVLMFLAAPMMLSVWIDAMDRFLAAPMAGG